MPCHRVPMDGSPRGGGMGFSPCSAYPPLTSPKIRTLLDCSTVRTQRQSAPWRVGYARVCGPLRPATGRHALSPSSHPLGSISLPYGWATTGVGSRGLTQGLVKKHVVRFGWRLDPGGRIGCRHPQHAEMSQPTYPFGDGLSASLAMAASRGFLMTRHWRSTLPSFPSPPPRRGWQRSEPCPQSFAPRMTRQHVWVGIPGHPRARTGSSSPCSILLHEPCEGQRMYVRSPPGHSMAKARGLRRRFARIELCREFLDALHPLISSLS
jgi:hypothetical protein